MLLSSVWSLVKKSIVEKLTKLKRLKYSIFHMICDEKVSACNAVQVAAYSLSSMLKKLSIVGWMVRSVHLDKILMLQ